MDGEHSVMIPQSHFQEWLQELEAKHGVPFTGETGVRDGKLWVRVSTIKDGADCHAMYCGGTSKMLRASLVAVFARAFN